MAIDDFVPIGMPIDFGIVQLEMSKIAKAIPKEKDKWFIRAKFKNNSGGDEEIIKFDYDIKQKTSTTPTINGTTYFEMWRSNKSIIDAYIAKFIEDRLIQIY